MATISRALMHFNKIDARLLSGAKTKEKATIFSGLPKKDKTGSRENKKIIRDNIVKQLKTYTRVFKSEAG